MGPIDCGICESARQVRIEIYEITDAIADECCGDDSNPCVSCRHWHRAGVEAGLAEIFTRNGHPHDGAT